MSIIKITIAADGSHRICGIHHCSHYETEKSLRGHNIIWPGRPQPSQLGHLQAASLTIGVEVHNCTKGQSSFSPVQCSLCAPGTYNMHAGGNCTACPEGAQCFGGATLVPQNQSWHSAPESDYIVGCPNNNACQRNITALDICQNAAYFQQLASNLSQVQLLFHLTFDFACAVSPH